MKNKRNIKILIPVVAVIWGLVLYKLFDAFYPEDHQTASLVSSRFEPPKHKKRDTFSLMLIERDPFLGSWYQEKSRPKSSDKEVKVPIEWPSTSYEGFVADDSGRTTVYVVSINGEQHLFKQGESIQEVKLLHGNAQSIVLQYKKNRKSLVLQ
ncbi:MAG: hypothetical protein AAF489_13065 [Bacteroidota bacterium]